MVSRSLALAIVAISFSTSAKSQQVVVDDLLVQGSLCVGTTCADGMDFGYNTAVISGDTPTLLFQDTSNSSSFPTTDWSVGLNAGNFVITNVDASLPVLQISTSGDSIALGGNATLVEGAISVGASGDERRVVNVADGVNASDAATYGQLQAAVSDASLINENQLAANQTRLTELSNEVENIGAVASAFSALSVNPRGKGDHFFSLGIGDYGGSSALAAGSFHFLANDEIFINTGIARALSPDAKTAVRFGLSFGG